MQIRRLLILLSGLLILTACTPAASVPTPTNTTAPIPAASTPIPPTPTITPFPTLPVDYDQLVEIFSYDRSAPLEVNILEEDDELNVLIQEITYRGGMGFDVPAYLIIPFGDGPYPAVIYLHMGGADRSQFLVEAVAGADMGIAFLLIDSPFVPRPWGGEEVRLDYPADIRTGIIRQVLDVRRGIDLLQSLPQIDPARIAYVGHSLGATFGGVVAGVEDRIQAYVLMAGSPSLSKILPEDIMDVSKYDDLDGIHYIGHAAPAPLLFQFAEFDQMISPAEAEQYYNAASQPKEIAWYEANHISLEWISRLDRLKWLSAQLGIEYTLEN